jgi:cytochrome c oxidase subunit IV/putative methionine-R-sulfoxide reductase with GAF domain
LLDFWNSGKFLHHRGLYVKVTLGDDRPTVEKAKLSAASRSVRTGLNRQSYLNWSLLVIAFLIIALGIITVVPPLLSEQLAAVWPMPKPQMVLIVVLSLALLTLTGLTHQQRYIAMLRREFERSQADEIARAKKHTNRMFALLNVSRVLGSSSDIEKIFDSITDMCVEAFNCDTASLMLFDNDTQELVIKSAAGQSVPSTMLGARLKLGEGIAGWAAKKGSPLLMGRDFDPTDYPELQLKNALLTSAMVVPIMLRDELVGVMNVSTRSRKIEYEKDDLRALHVFAENIGSCIRHTEQASWMRQTIRNLQEAVKTNKGNGQQRAGVALSHPNDAS